MIFFKVAIYLTCFLMFMTTGGAISKFFHKERTPQQRGLDLFNIFKYIILVIVLLGIESFIP